jgi:hypothetical protein
MAEAIRDSGNEITSPWVLGPIENPDPTIIDIFQRDMIGAETSDAIVADISNPSIGVGMEIMAAYKAHRKIILVLKKGNANSRMLQHMDRKTVVEFDDEGEIYPKLVMALSQAETQSL